MDVMEITIGSDRAAAIVGSAYVEDALERSLRKMLRQDEKALDDLFGARGALGSFGSQIELGYLLTIYDDDVRSDLKNISRIRNSFAHEHGRITFQTQSIADRVRNFRSSAWLIRNIKDTNDIDKVYPNITDLVSAFRFGVSDVQKTLSDPREHYISLAFALATYLPLRRMAVQSIR